MLPRRGPRMQQLHDSQYVAVNYNEEDLPENMAYASRFAPLTVRDSRRGKDGRVNLRSSSKGRWKDFKLRNESNIIRADEETRRYILDITEAGQRQEHDERHKRHKTSKTESFAQLRSALLPRLLRDMADVLSQSAFLKKEAEHFKEQFNQLQDRPRFEAAQKHYVYSDSAMQMGLMTNYHLPSSSSHARLLATHESLVERARNAHRVKEAAYKSKVKTAW
ncbi:hypothetical protein CBS101457_005113 [Exobasidium rhododendri]|nr:hypothetical protein CBS101457_005113 [Exobasidium rhododendri]